MGFGVRIAPGVRISASSRGLRAGIGPRAARVHVGAGRPSISSGMGPVTVWAPLGGSRRRRGSRGPSLAAYERELRAADRQAELEHWAALNRRLLDLCQAHLEAFPPAAQPVAEPAEAVDAEEVHRRMWVEHRRGIPWWRRTARREARRLADEAAAREVQSLEEQRRREHEARQRALDEHWDALQANDLDAVFAALEHAFEDNETPAAPIGLEGHTAMVVMRIGRPEELIPERSVTTTPTGRPTHRKRSKTDLNDLYALLLGSQALAVVREALAVAPGIHGVAIVVIRGEPVGGHTNLEVLYAGSFDRALVEGLAYDEALNPLTVLEQQGEIHYRGRTHEVAALDLRHDPRLAEVAGKLATDLGWSPTA